jgi:hypothetical protein
MEAHNGAVEIGCSFASQTNPIIQIRIKVKSRIRGRSKLTWIRRNIYLKGLSHEMDLTFDDLDNVNGKLYVSRIVLTAYIL